MSSDLIHNESENTDRNGAESHLLSQKCPDIYMEVHRPVYTQPHLDADFQYTPVLAPTCRERARKCCSEAKCSTSCGKSVVNKTFPFVGIMKRYKVKRDFVGDVVAGLTVGIMHIPQGMAYGLLANTSPVHGLYVSFFAPLIYFFFGTSRHVALGTMAIVSLMVGSVVDKAGCPEDAAAVAMDTISGNHTQTAEGSTAWPAENVTLHGPGGGGVMSESLMCRVGVATSLAFTVGVIQIGLGLLRLGFVTIYLSEPLTRAFTTAAACHVVTSQLKYMTGIPVGRHSGAFKLPKMYIDFIKNIAQINWGSVVLSVICMIVLALFKEFINPKVKAKIKMPIPIELVVIIIATIISHFANFNTRFGMHIVEEVPRGIPAPMLPEFGRMPELAADAFSIAVVVFAINLSLAKLFAKKHVYNIDSNQELVSYGITNITGSFFHCFTSAAALSRSLLQDALGGRTQVAGLVSCCFLLIILYGVGVLFESLPNSVLAAIVVVNLKGMFLQLKDLPVLWRVSKPDCVIWLVVFLAVVLLDVDIGLLIGVIFCMLTVVFRTQSPQTNVLGHTADMDLYRDTSAYKKCQETSNVKVFQFHSPLYYANCEYFINSIFKQSTVNPRELKRARQKAAKKLKRLETNGPKPAADPETLIVNPGLQTLPDSPVSTIIVDCSLMSYIDSMGVSTLQQVIGEYKEVGVDILLSGCHDGMRETLEAADFFKKISRDSLFPSVHDAVLFPNKTCSVVEESAA